MVTTAARVATRKYLGDTNLPAVFTFFSIDLLPTASAQHCGRIGILGERCGNYLIQHCDLLIVLGCRLTKAHVGYNPDLFAPAATIVAIDIDQDELDKDIVPVAHKLHCDIEEFYDHTPVAPAPSVEWLAECGLRRRLWLGDLPPAPSDDAHGICQYRLVAALGPACAGTPTTFVACAGSVVILPSLSYATSSGMDSPAVFAVTIP